MIIESLKYLAIAVVISGFSGTMAFAVGFAIVSCTRSAEDTRSGW